jgi:Asp-tRNA(Asn)/Glu-tRNA(Gln) amidotransferase A subunit family amidase
MAQNRFSPMTLNTARALRDKDGVEALFQMVLSRAADWADNAVIAQSDRMPETALGPLCGIPFGVKDNIDCLPFATTGGTPALAGFHPNADAPPVARLKAAGGYVPVKLNLHELAFGITSNNAAYGPVRNPFDPARVSGGSSGGNAAAIARGVIPFALGTDTGGSTRIPAAFCGIAGFRPSTGRYPDGGVLTLSTTRDTIGPMAVTCADLAEVDALIVPGSDPDLPQTLRIGVLRAQAGLCAAVDAAIAGAFGRLSAAPGVTLVPLEVPAFDDLDARFGNAIVFCETFDVWTRFASEKAGLTFAAFADLIASPDVRGLFQALPTLAKAEATAYATAMAQDLPDLRAAYARLFADHALDLIAMPTVSVQPPLIGEDDMMQTDLGPRPTFDTVAANTALATLTGAPSLAIPAGLDSGRLPVSLMIEALPGQDRLLLRLGQRIEALLAGQAA